jgi:hypothetical protein
VVVPDFHQGGCHIKRSNLKLIFVKRPPLGAYQRLHMGRLMLQPCVGNSNVVGQARLPWQGVVASNVILEHF